MKLALYFTLACSAKCDHCITYAAPGVTRRMPIDDVMRLIEQASNTVGIDGICFTGGETLMHRSQALDLVRECARRGLRSEIISNAFWAKDPARSFALAQALRDAGLERLHVSIDTYHLPYVPRDYVHFALNALRECGFMREISCVIDNHFEVDKRLRHSEAMSGARVDPENWNELDAERLSETLAQFWPARLRDLLDLYGFLKQDLIWIDEVVAIKKLIGTESAIALAHHFYQSKILLQYQTMATEGRGRSLLSKAATLHADEAPDEACDSVGNTPTVTPEGNLFPCCSSWVNVPGQRLGTLKDSGPAELLESMQTDPIVQFMTHQGPRALVKFLRDRGHGLPERYSHPCHFCGTLLEGYSREDLIKYIEQFYEELPWRRLITSRGLQFVPIAE